MSDSTQNYPAPIPYLSASGKPNTDFRGISAVLILAIVAAVSAGLFVCAHWSIVLVGGTAVLALSVVESEAFLSFVILSMPFAWLLDGHNVLLAMHAVVVVGFFSGRLLRGNAVISQLLRPAISRASLLFLCATAIPLALISQGLTLDSARALYELATYIGFYFVVLAWVDSRQRMRKVLWLLLWSTLATAIFAVYQQIIGGFSPLWLYLNPPDEYTVPWAGRSPSFLGHPNSLAFYLGLALPFALACYIRGHGQWKKLGGWTLGLGFLALLSTQSVGGILAFVCILVLAIFYFARNRSKALAYFAGICGLVGLLYLLKPILNPTHTEDSLGADVVMRLLLWDTAWNFFAHSPVMGVGWGNFVRLYGSEFSSSSSMAPPAGVFEVHNIYLQLLAETGLVGFMTFFYLVVRSWREATQLMRSSLDSLDVASAFGVLGALLSLLVHGAIDVPFFAQSGILFWVVLALLTASVRLKNNARVIHDHPVGAL
jgi:putative inorganic carbon (HCO3(-)) transporter